MQLAGFADASAMLASGVYALVFHGVVVYVGKSKMMLGRVYTHRSLGRRGKAATPSWLPVKAIRFDAVWVRPCPLDQLDSVEREMIDLYKPQYNTVHKGPDKIATAIPIRVNGISLTLNAHAKPKLGRRI